MAYRQLAALCIAGCGLLAFDPLGDLLGDAGPGADTDSGVALSCNTALGRDGRGVLPVAETGSVLVLATTGPAGNALRRSRAGYNYLRIRETAGMVYFETSADKQTWSRVHMEATPFAVADVQIWLLSESAATTTADTVRFDDVNH